MDLFVLAFVVFLACTCGYIYFPTMLAIMLFVRLYTTTIFNSTIEYIVDNPGNTVGIIGIYWTIGIIWAYIKWNVYVSDYKQTHDKLDVSAQAFVKRKLSDIYIWWMFWPLSILYSVFGEYLYKFFKYIFYNVLMEFFTNVVDRYFNTDKIK